jgi:hypothetical protein
VHAPGGWLVPSPRCARTCCLDIEQVGPVVKLTVMHGDFEPGSLVLEGVSQGWPSILANLKTLLETGGTLPQAAVATDR